MYIFYCLAKENAKNFKIKIKLNTYQLFDTKKSKKKVFQKHQKKTFELFNFAATSDLAVKVVASLTTHVVEKSFFIL